MHLLDAKEEILCNIEAGNASMLTSGSGMGKSSIMHQIFNELAAAAPAGEWGMGVSFAATMNPIDTMGVPFKGTYNYKNYLGEDKTLTVTDPSVPLWMISTEGKPASCYRHFFWFCDEYGQGEADTKRGLSEIFLSGGNGMWRLPPGSVRVAASNTGQRYGVTKDFDFAIARRTIIPIEGNIDITLNYLDKPYAWQGKQWQTMPVVKAWARAHSEIVFEAEPKEQGPWCNPRTLCSFDRYLQAKAARFGGNVPIQDKDQAARITAMGAGTIGMGATSSIMAHLRFKLELPQYENVVKDPVGTPVPKKADLLMLMAYELAGRTQIPDLAPVLQYIQRLPQDMCVTFVQALLRRDYKNIINNPVMQAWVHKNASLISIIEALAH
jgi:hypothetical protein